MRVFAVAAFTALALAGAAHAESPKCTETLDGGTRCTELDGHVTERRPDGEGGIRTTSTIRGTGGPPTVTAEA